HEGRTGGELDGAVLERTDPEFGALQVDEDANGVPQAFLDGPDTPDKLLQQFVAGVTHVDAEDVGPGARQFLDHLLVARSRAERGENLHTSHTSRRLAAPSCVLLSGRLVLGFVQFAI